MTQASEQIAQQFVNSGINRKVWGDIIVNVKAYGVEGDGITDDTEAIHRADAAAKLSGAPLYFPPGIYKVTALILNAPFIYGAGWLATEIKGSTINDDVITLASPYTHLSDMRVTSSISAASRTGAGIKVTGGAYCLVSRVQTFGHKYGIWNQGQGNEFEHIVTYQNNSHGFFIDGSVQSQNEIGIYFCQSNSNEGDGFHLSGPGLGVRMTNVTAASNSGWGINNLNGLNDIWITQPEISGNAGGIQTVGCSDIQIVSPFIESSTGGANLWIESPLTTITGGFVQAASHETLGHGIVINHTDVSITGMTVSSNNCAGIRLGVGSARVTLAGVVISNIAATGVSHDQALQIDAGAGPFTAAACDFSAISTVVSGTIPNGSALSACRGLLTQLNQAWDASGDTPINGYLQFVDSTGTVRKVATIA